MESDENHIVFLTKCKWKSWWWFYLWKPCQWTNGKAFWFL